MKETTRDTSEALVLVRADSFEKAMVALSDLVRYGGLRILGDPRVIPSALSEWVLENVTGERVRKRFRVNVVVRVRGKPGRVIGRIMNLRSPAHVLVVQEDERPGLELLRGWKGFKKLRGFHPPKGSKVRG